MLLKTKLLLTLGGLGVVAGTSSGVYYLKNKDVSGEGDTKVQPASVEVQPGLDEVRNAGSDVRSDDGPSVSKVKTPTPE